MVVQACKLNLSLFSLSSSPPIISLLFEPNSLSLALMHSDSSFSLYPSISPFSISSPSPPPQSRTLIQPHPSSCSSFLLLNSNPNPNSPNPRVLFVVAGPHKGGAEVLLRFWILRKTTQVFARAQVICTQRNLKCDDRLGVVVNMSHGVSVKLAASVNVLAMYSVSNSKIWVFAVKMAGDDDGDGVAVRLMKCSVIEWNVPIWSISVSFGYLMLGEDSGVRVFPLRPLVKGRVKKQRRESKSLNGRLEGQPLNFSNGVSRESDETHSKSESGINNSGGGSTCLDGTVTETFCNSYLEGKLNTQPASVKLRSANLKQDTGACFVAFDNKEVASSKSATKAISIGTLSPNMFLVLDSVGDLHVLHLSNPILGSKITCYMRRLTHNMKVQKLAVFPDISTRTQTIWISDGFHSVHLMAVSDMDSSANENDKNNSEEKPMQIPVNQAIFTSEKIQDIIPVAANAILILGQGSIFAYEIF